MKSDVVRPWLGIVRVAVPVPDLTAAVMRPIGTARCGRLRACTLGRNPPTTLAIGSSWSRYRLADIPFAVSTPVMSQAAHSFSWIVSTANRAWCG
jgi:hypothetical protein